MHGEVVDSVILELKASRSSEYVAAGLTQRAQSKIELYDLWASEHGFLTREGKSPPWMREYMAALNSARLSLRALNEHLKLRKSRNALEAAERDRERHRRPRRP
jgi:hypothetical protein